MEEIEYRRASSDGRFRFDVEQENRHETASTCLQDAKNLSHIVLDLIRKHVREDGASCRQAAKADNLIERLLAAPHEQLGVGKWPNPNTQAFRWYGQIEGGHANLLCGVRACPQWVSSF